MRKLTGYDMKINIIHFMQKELRKDTKEYYLGSYRIVRNNTYDLEIFLNEKKEKSIENVIGLAFFNGKILYHPRREPGLSEYVYVLSFENDSISEETGYLEAYQTEGEVEEILFTLTYGSKSRGIFQELYVDTFIIEEFMRKKVIRLNKGEAYKWNEFLIKKESLLYHSISSERILIEKAVFIYQWDEVTLLYLKIEDTLSKNFKVLKEGNDGIIQTTGVIDVSLDSDGNNVFGLCLAGNDNRCKSFKEKNRKLIVSKAVLAENGCSDPNAEVFLSRGKYTIYNSSFDSKEANREWTIEEYYGS